MGYTKGPWEIWDYQIVSKEDGSPGMSSLPNSVFKVDLKLICSMPGSMNWPDAPSNARLISAAPDLLEACLMYRDMLTPAQECCDAMDKAIKKALGE